MLLCRFVECYFRMTCTVCSECRCKDCRNHFELRKATGAVAIQFNAEAHSLIVLVRLFVFCFSVILLQYLVLCVVLV